LIWFGLISISLQIHLLFDFLFAEEVVTPADSHFETQVEKKIA